MILLFHVSVLPDLGGKNNTALQRNGCEMFVQRAFL